MADLHLAWRVVRVQVGPMHDVMVVGPVGQWANETAVGRAFSCAAARRGRIVTVGDPESWRRAVVAERSRWDGLEAEEASLGDALVRLRDDPESVDVVVTEAHLVDAVVDAAAAFAGSRAVVAHAWLPDEGPGVFAPGSTEPDDDAGFGVVDPTGMLLATSLMLAEGLSRRSASRTLERAVGNATGANGHHRDTRAFTDAVIDLLPQSRTDVDHFDEVWH
jgi:isocitrate/isopropylmalate dehydrogenase